MWWTASPGPSTQARLYFLTKLRKLHLPPPVLSTFYREHPEQLHHTLLWELPCLQLQDSPEESEESREDQQDLSSIHHRHLESTQHCRRSITSSKQTLSSPAVWKKLPQHSVPQHWTLQQFLPTSQQRPLNTSELTDPHTHHVLHWLAELQLHRTVHIWHICNTTWSVLHCVQCLYNIFWYCMYLYILFRK